MKGNGIMGNYCVYKHTAPNGKVYIGITGRNPSVRWRENGFGYKSSPHFYSAIEKYGWENIEHEILFTGLDKDEACNMEKLLIQKYKSYNRAFGYNATFGGETGLKITPEIREKISNQKKKYYSDPKAREAVSKRMKGVPKSDECRLKLRDVAKRRKPYTRTKETREKVGAKNKLRFSTNEWKEQHKDQLTRLAQYGTDKSKQVVQCDKTGTPICTFKSMKDAYRKTGVRDGNISKCCNGITKTAGGYIWRFVS